MIFTLNLSFQLLLNYQIWEKSGPEFLQFSTLPKPIHLSTTALSSSTGQTPALPHPTPHSISHPTVVLHIGGTLILLLFIYSFVQSSFIHSLKIRKEGTLGPLICALKKGNKQGGVHYTLSGLPAFLTVTCLKGLYMGE